jgi:diacylglycerol O-acyltransferase / wax synthase
MTTPGGTYMGASDAFSWHMERDPVLRPSIVVAVSLDRAPEWDALVARVDRTTRLMPSLRQRVIDSPLPLISPRWIYDPHFDLNWHMRRIRVPEPRTWDAVLQLARRPAMDTFDRARPLWELTLVEDLQDGRAALIAKVHHSLSDGISGMHLLAAIADQKRKPRRLGEMPPAPPGEKVEPRALATDAAGVITAQLTRLARRGAGAAMPALIRSVRDPEGLAREAVAMARSVYRTAGPSSGAMSPLMRERATTRHLAVMEVSLDALKAAAATAGGTVNDAYLTVITGGLRRYHERHGTLAKSLRAVVPVNLRAKDDTGWGNKITLQRLILPVGEPNPRARMRALHRVIEAARSEPSLPVTGVIAGMLNMLPVGYVGGILKHVDFLASNVTGPPAPVYLAGSKVTGLFAFGPTIGASVNTTLLSYAGTCRIGINIDTAAVPDPDVLLACLQESLAEVTALGTAEPVPAQPAGDHDGPSSTPAVKGLASTRGDHGEGGEIHINGQHHH